MDFHSGVRASAKINDVELATTNWSVDPSVDIVNFRNSQTNEYSVKEATFKNCTGTVDVDFDFDDNPFVAAQPITIGTILTDLKLYLDDENNAGLFWEFPEAIVVSTPQAAPTEGKITTSIRFENSGAFYPPGIGSGS